MEEVLKQILEKINGLETRIDKGFEAVNDRMDSTDKSNKTEFRQLNQKLDSLTNAVAKTMEDITELKSAIQKQDVEIRVIKAAK